MRETAQRRPGSKPRRQASRMAGSFHGRRRAQRRPGSKPRRQSWCVRKDIPWGKSLNEGRGRNPGDRRWSRDPPGAASRKCAQRRPGSKPRRQSKTVGTLGDSRQRSTKAGVETPATVLIALETVVRVRSDRYWGPRARETVRNQDLHGRNAPRARSNPSFSHRRCIAGDRATFGSPNHWGFAPGFTRSKVGRLRAAVGGRGVLAPR